MATIANVVTQLESLYGHAHQIKWLLMTQATTDVGDAIAMPGASDRSIQVTGTFGVGGTVIIEGSNDGGATYATLTDPQGNALSFTAAKIEQIEEISGLLRPRVTAGDGSTSLNVYLLVRRPL